MSELVSNVVVSIGHSHIYVLCVVTMSCDSGRCDGPRRFFIATKGGQFENVGLSGLL